MAKENTVYLYGRVKQPPRIYKNKAGQYVLGKIVVDTNRKSYATEELLLRGEIRRDSILVRTEHEEMIRDVYTLINEGDFVQIKGTLCTKEYQREPLCMHCHEVMERCIDFLSPIGYFFILLTVPIYAITVPLLRLPGFSSSSTHISSSIPTVVFSGFATNFFAS